METVTLQVQGMSCGHCVSAVESSVGKMNGVSSVQVTLSEKKVEVTFNKEEVTLDEIKQEIDEQGYEVI